MRSADARFRYAIAKNPGDFDLRRVYADFLDEGDRPDDARAWRWTAELALAPVLFDAAVAAVYAATASDGDRSYESEWVGKWHWFPAYQSDTWPAAFRGALVPYAHVWDPRHYVLREPFPRPLQALDALVAVARDRSPDQLAAAAADLAAGLPRVRFV